MYFFANPLALWTGYFASFFTIIFLLPAEVVIRPKGCFRGKLDDHVAFMGRLVAFILDVPTKGVEKGIQKIDPYLGFGIALLEVVVFVLLELADQ